MYRETYRGFKSLILRKSLGNPPKLSREVSLYAELDESRTVEDVPISKDYLRKITAERARRDRPDFIAPEKISQFKNSQVGAPLQKVVRNAPVLPGKIVSPDSTKVVKLDVGRISIVDAIKIFGWTNETKFSWQLDKFSITLVAQEGGEFAFDASNRILIPMNLRRRLNISLTEQVIVISNSTPIANVQITPIHQIHKYIKEVK